MAEIVEPSLKEDLVGLGVWGEFCRLREKERTADDGLTPLGASVEAMRKLVETDRVPHDYVDRLTDGGVGDGAGRLRKRRVGRRKKEVVLAGVDESETSPIGDQSADSPDLSSADERVFEGKVCTKGAAYEWAFSKQFVRGTARPEDAPSQFAWSLYAFFRMSPAAMIDISKQYVSSSIRKEVDDGGVRGTFDGQEQYDLAKSFAEEMRKEARK